jgi:hypothetical protein
MIHRVGEECKLVLVFFCGVFDPGRWERLGWDEWHQGGILQVRGHGLENNLCFDSPVVRARYPGMVSQNFRVQEIAAPDNNVIDDVSPIS